MKKIFLLLYLLILGFVVKAQNLIPASVIFNPSVTSVAELENKSILITLDVNGLTAPAGNTTAVFTLNSLTLTNSPQLTTSNIIITHNEWVNAVSKNSGKIQIPLNLQTNTYTAAPQFDETATITASTDADPTHLYTIHFSSKPIPVVTNTTITLKSGSTSINPLYSKEDKIKTDSAHISLDVSGNILNDTAILFETILLTLPNHPVLLNNPLKITKARWDTLTNVGKKTGTLDTFLYVQTAFMPDTLKEDEIGQIIIHGQPQQFHILRLTEKGLYNPGKPFWIETGANFDLLDGIKANNCMQVFTCLKKILPELALLSTKKIKIMINQII